MKKKLVFAGTGGQGVLLMARLVCMAAIQKGMHAVMSQTYGVEQRGGDCTGFVVISDDTIGSPIIENDADVCVVMSSSMLSSTRKMLKPGGTMILNTSLVPETPDAGDIRYVRVSATEIANRIGDRRSANIVVLGSLVAATDILPPRAVMEAVAEMIAHGNPAKLEINQKAFEEGIRYGRGEN